MLRLKKVVLRELNTSEAHAVVGGDETEITCNGCANTMFTCAGSDCVGTCVVACSGGCVSAGCTRGGLSCPPQCVWC